MSKNPPEKKRKLHSVRLTKYELLHLRDLFSVLLPPEGTQTLSQALAALEGRTLIESLLWRKVSAACEAVEIPTGDEAPDFVIAPSASPPLALFQLSSDPPGDDEEGLLEAAEDDEE